MRMHALTNLKTAIVMGLALAGAAATGEAAGPRTWHVAPKDLPGIAAGDQARTIAEAAAKVGPGDTVVIHGGVYREAVTVEAGGTAEKPIRFLAAPGEHVVVSGSDVIQAWTK